MSRLPALFMIAALPFLTAAGESPSLYEEYLKSPKHVTTLQSMGAAMLGLPYDREQITSEIIKHFWVNHEDVKVEDGRKALEIARLKNTLETIEEVMVRNELRVLEFFGFTRMGSMNSLDLYLSANTVTGPVLIRMSISFAKDKPRIFDIRLYEGFDETRKVISDIHERSTKAILSVTYQPKKKEGT